MSGAFLLVTRAFRSEKHGPNSRCYTFAIVKRELDKNPQPPDLTERAISLLTILCFREDNPAKAEVIFEFSTLVNEREVADVITELLDQGVSRKVVLTGGTSHYSDIEKTGKPEADLVGDLMPRKRFKDVDFVFEKTSTNLIENIQHALEADDFSTSSSLLFITKSHAAGRSYLSLRKYFPKTELFQRTYPAVYPGHQALTKDNWYSTDFGRSRIWGEYLRIKMYGERGDIAVAEAESLIAAIAEELTT